MRKLTVKNFSVIKDAELEFGKITVLIGPQASGKSLLCKLAYFLGGEVIGFAVDSLLDKNSWDDYLQSVKREFHARFSTEGWLRKNFRASFRSEAFVIKLEAVGDPLKPEIEFSIDDEFRDLYNKISSRSLQPSRKDLSRSELRGDLWVELSLFLDRRRTQTLVYIPSGRAFFTDPSKSVSALQNPDIDQITKRFAGQIAWDTRWKVGLVTTGRNVLTEIEAEFNRIAGGIVRVAAGKPLFLSLDGRSLPLALQSSGTLEVLPAFNVVSQLAFNQEHIYARRTASEISPLADVVDHSPLIYLEEPESHVFPRTQYDLVKLFAWLAGDPVLSFDWVITTHSPYILSAFGDLVKAGLVGAQSKEHHAAVAKVIPEKYWIAPSDFAAYKIENGKLESIFDKNSGQIDGDYLDDVSGKISEEFGQLLEVQYGK